MKEAAPREEPLEFFIKGQLPAAEPKILETAPGLKRRERPRLDILAADLSKLKHFLVTWLSSVVLAYYCFFGVNRRCRFFDSS